MRGAEGFARFQQRLRRGRDAEMGEADRRRHDEDRCGDQAGHHADTEKDNRRNQIYEGRQGLHEVEDRPEHRVEARAVGGGDADRHADPHAQHAGGNHQRQRLHRLVPVALVEDEQKGDDGEGGRQPVAPQNPGEHGEHGYDDEGMRGLEDQQQRVDQSLHDEGQTVEQPGDVVGQPVDDGLRALADGDPVVPVGDVLKRGVQEIQRGQSPLVAADFT